MKGLALSRKYFADLIYPSIQENFQNLRGRLAYGLVGEGSECYGLDDDLSKDHDFYPRLMIWMEEDDYQNYGCSIKELLTSLSNDDNGYSNFRTGPIATKDFYQRYTSFKEFPIEDLAYFKIPETFLSTATNGEVFLDELGEFSRIRAYLKGHYPKDVCLKKLAKALSLMGQAGQYNYPRSIKRGDLSAVFFSKAEFVENAYQALYLLSRNYKPYYKLSHAYLSKLNYYPKELLDDMIKLQSMEDSDLSIGLIEKISVYLADILRHRKLIRTADNFLVNVALDLMENIQNETIKSMHIMEG